MAFTINKTDGTILATVQDGTLDQTTNLSLFGKNYAGYGELLNENQIKLLENFANTTENAPDKPIKGMLFYDTTKGQVQVYDGPSFKAATGSIVSTSQPSTGSTGDLWFDSTNEQVYVYNGSSWVLIGPIASAGAGTTGSISATITDDTGVARSVIQDLVNDTIVSITSTVAFTPQTAITGFASIAKGVNLSTAISDAKFTGTSTDADALGSTAATNFLKSNADDTTSGTISIQKDASLILGADGDVTATQSGSNFTLKNTTSDGNIIFNVNDGGSDTTALTITGSDASVTVANDLTVTGSLTVNGTTSTISTTNTTIEDNIIVLNSGQTASIVGGAGGFDSSSADSTVGNDIGIIFDRGIHANVGFIFDESRDEFALINTTEDGTSTGDITISSYATLHATATSAQYSDLAERYESDVVLEAGDVVKIGGSKEVTKTTQEGDTDVFGVVSTQPAFKMNADAGDNDTHPYIALSGRVPCKVKGPVTKGDRLIASAQEGVAEAVQDISTLSLHSVLGRSLETSDDNEVKYIEIVVGKN